MPDLNRQIKKHYASKSLSQNRLDSLINEGKLHRRQRWQRLLLPLAAAAILVIGFTFFTDHQNQSNLNQRVIAEIAMNHSKQLDIEIETHDYSELQTQMDRIDFPIYSNTIPQDYQLVGGRYCSIQSELAAQLKLQHKKTGDVTTLYVTRLTDHLQQIPEQTAQQDHVSIQLWKTSDRLFGLAQTIQQ